MFRLIIVSMFVFFTSSAFAAEGKTCTATSMLMGPGFDFFNTGTYAGGKKTTTSFSVVECEEKNSPLYMLGVGIVPGFGAGLEGDVRMGGRFKCGIFDCDLSGAYYAYKVSDHAWENTLDLRAIVSKSYNAWGGQLTPYIWLDEQLPLQAPHRHYFGGRAGAKYAYVATTIPGQPTFGIDMSAWHYFSAPVVGKTILIADLSVGFHPNPGPANLTIGPFFRLTQGATNVSGVGNVHRHMLGGFVSLKF